MLAEIVSGTVKVPTRELADASAFRQDAEKIVIRKARQLYQTAANLLRQPQPAASPLSAPPARIFPVVVIGGDAAGCRLQATQLDSITSVHTAHQLTSRIKIQAATSGRHRIRHIELDD